MSYKPTYRLNAEESEVLQHQVMELKERGYFHENIILSAIPPLLIFKKDGSWHMCVGSRYVKSIDFQFSTRWHAQSIIRLRGLFQN